PPPRCTLFPYTTLFRSKSLEEAMVAAYNDKAKAGLFNQLGQHYNHIHFWNWMAPKGGGTKLPSRLESAIKSDLGGYDTFRGKLRSEEHTSELQSRENLV